MRDEEPLSAELHSAEKTLKDSLAAACNADVEHVDTGELIKVEEMLAIATDAAKRAISIRRKRRQQLPAQGIDRETAATGAGTQRRFLDEQGMEWMVRAVHPAARTDVRHARLLGSYQQGWLAFESSTAKRRLSPIPANWADLDDTSLRALCTKADAAPKRGDRER